MADVTALGPVRDELLEETDAAVVAATEYGVVVVVVAAVGLLDSWCERILVVLVSTVVDRMIVIVVD